MEPRFNRDFGDVRVHTGGKASESAQAVNALAYTVGRDIVFSDGFYSPGTTAGQRLLAHELVHTVQQSNATVQTATGISQPGDIFEQEADRVAEKVMRSVLNTQTASYFGAASAPDQVIDEDEEDGVIDSDSSGPPSRVKADSVAEMAMPLIQMMQGRSANRMIMRTPSVALWDFHNTNGTNTASDNCCALCPRPLGVGNTYSGRMVNGMELQAFLNDEPGASYDIKRTIKRSVWQRAGGAWSLLSNRPAGSNDDPNNDDECLTPIIKAPSLPYVYVEDQPGIANTSLFSASATEGVYKATFTESMDITTAAGVTHDPTTFNWHSILWLVKSSGSWTVDATRSEIAPGSITIGATP
jgi:hypothetical protein